MNGARAASGPIGWLLGQDERARTWRLVLLCLGPAVALIGTLRFDFVFDDLLVILRDPAVTGDLSFSAIFGNRVRVGSLTLEYYRPVITLLYHADYWLWGANPAGYHFTNLLWHLLATAAVYKVASHTTGRPATAWIAGMLFGLLPAHTEAIGWIQGRVDLVATTFALLSLLALLKMRTAKSAGQIGWGAMAGGAFLGSLLCKESVAVLPLAWAMWEILPRGAGEARWPRRLTRFLPLLAGGLLYWLLRSHAVGPHGIFPVALSPLGLRCLALLAVLGEYFRTLLLPGLGLSFFQPVWVSSASAETLLGASGSLLLGGGLVAAWRRDRSLFPWVAWIPITLLPPLLFLLYRSAPEVGFYIAERFLYLPSVGWCILAGVIIARWLEARPWLVSPAWRVVGLVGLLVGYATLTAIRLAPWSDPVDHYVAMKSQRHLPPAMRLLIRNNLGQLLLERGELANARTELEAALQLGPEDPRTHNNMGVLLIREGRSLEAVPWLEAAIRLDPAYADAYGNLGAAEEALGNSSAARAAYEAGLRLDPTSSRLRAGLRRSAQRAGVGAAPTGEVGP